jgi:hypothetical protein
MMAMLEYRIATSGAVAVVLSRPAFGVDDAAHNEIYRAAGLY